jgi:hypothetical protein
MVTFNSTYILKAVFDLLTPCFSSFRKRRPLERFLVIFGKVLR